MACFSWKDRGYLKMAKGLFCSLLDCRNKQETNCPVIHDTLGSASRTSILGKSSLSAGAATIDWEWEETHGKEPKGMVVLNGTVPVSSETHLHSFTCFVTLGRLLYSFVVAVHLWKWSRWCSYKILRMKRDYVQNTQRLALSIARHFIQNILGKVFPLKK